MRQIQLTALPELGPQPVDWVSDVRVRTTTVIAGDCRMRGLCLPPCLDRPVRLYSGVPKSRRITTLGVALDGEIEAVAAATSRFSAEQRVVTATEFRVGGYAEHAVLPSDGMIAAVSERISLDDTVKAHPYAESGKRIGRIVVAVP